jgi:hypothetical protein
LDRFLGIIAWFWVFVKGAVKALANFFLKLKRNFLFIQNPLK